MADKILSQHTVTMENRRNVKITGVVQVTSYDEYKIVLRTDYGKLTVSGRNLVAGEISTDSGILQLEGDIDFLQYSRDKGKSEKGLAKLLR
ncbi:MAG: sporulation protein YabP [Oscillospiraceae bacterium]|nr:sporulation protein YabP [Oscillospiraceae bacterium]